MDAVMDAGASRLRDLRRDRPDLSFEDDYMDTEVGTRGLIRLLDAAGEVIGLEFIEPEGFWTDPDAVEEYAETIGLGIAVTVLVPSSEALAAEAFLREEVSREISVMAYDEGERSHKHH